MNSNKEFYFIHPFTHHFCNQLWVLKEFKKLPKDYDLVEIANTIINSQFDLVHVFLIGLRNGKCHSDKNKIHDYLKELMEFVPHKNFKDNEGNNYLHFIAYYIRDGVHMDYYNGSKQAYNNNLKCLSYAYEFFSENYPEMNREKNNSQFLPGDYLLKKFKQPYKSEHNTFLPNRNGLDYYSVLNLYKVENVRESLTIRSRLSLNEKLKHFDNLIDHCLNSTKEGTMTARENMKELLNLLIAVKEKNNLTRMMEKESLLVNEENANPIKVKKVKI